ncbi:MAG: VWA domain-containing protein, partial [Gammaproteobacteria bacterium]|nr:VWA domain-containing protein [Gammaproteobacteria bacterium]
MADVPHFLHPQWLWALLPLLALLWLLWRRPDSDNPWRRVVAHNLQPLLLGRRGEAGDRRQRRWLALLGAGWLLAVLALADPVWDRAPRPVYESQTARVIVLDLSLSMLTRDLAPSRLVRARFKVEDIVRLAGEGQVGLVVFAGDAFTVTPLTRDAATLRSQLRALEPAIMPAQGSRADLGLRQAGDLLGQAGLTHGDVLLIADGVEGDRAASAASQLRQQGFRVSVLGVGTRAGAPLADADGRSLRDANGNVVVPKLEVQALQDVAAAGGGVYTDITPDARDVVMLVDQGATSARVEQSDDPASATRWHERGPWLVLALLPLAALAFRRGWLFSIALLGVFTVPAPPAMAATSQPWDDLWQTSEQRAADALAEGDFARASALANDPL